MKRQWKGFISGVLVTLLVVGLIGSAMATVAQQAVTISYNDIKVTLDGKEIVPKDAEGNPVEPFLFNNTTYLPIRGIASALGLNVAWDGETRTAKLTTAAAEPEKKPEEKPASGETMGQKNALAKAKSYLSIMAFSYQGLIKQLEFEKFSHEDAVYGADHCGADWNEQAAKKAKSYLSITAFSRDSLISQLEFEGFTREQAVYGVEQNGY